MSDYIFLFDMDSTITRKEVLLEIAQKINRLDEMRRLTEVTKRRIESSYSVYNSTELVDTVIKLINNQDEKKGKGKSVLMNISMM